jgi:hypothetical protein
MTEKVMTASSTYMPFSHSTFNSTTYNRIHESEILLTEKGNFACTCPCVNKRSHNIRIVNKSSEEVVKFKIFGNDSNKTKLYL